MNENKSSLVVRGMVFIAAMVIIAIIVGFAANQLMGGTGSALGQALSTPEQKALTAFSNGEATFEETSSMVSTEDILSWCESTRARKWGRMAETCEYYE